MPVKSRTDVEVLSLEHAYRGYFRIDRYRLRHRLHQPPADGDGWTGELEREVFERGHVAALLPYDPVRDEVVLIEQFRVGAYAAARDPWLVEVVAGIIEDGESARDVAVRETLEETGLEVADLVPVQDYLVSPGGTSETVALFCGKVDATSAGGIHGRTDEGEDIRVFSMGFEDVRRGLHAEPENGHPRLASNAMTIIALQWLLLNRDALRQRWA